MKRETLALKRLLSILGMAFLALGQLHADAATNDPPVDEQSGLSDLRPKLSFCFQPNEMDEAEATWKGYVQRGEEKPCPSGPNALTTPGGGACAVGYVNPPKSRFTVSFKVKGGGPSTLGKCEVTNLETGEKTTFSPSKPLAEDEEVCFIYDYSPGESITKQEDKIGDE